MSANFTPEKEDLKILTPFKMQVLTNFPYIEADFDALTNYQLLCKVVEYLNNTITEMNEVTEQTEGLYNAYVSLQNYVNNYFDNLDIQEEVNTKIDELVEDGTLTNLIKEYVDPIYQEYETEINNEILNFKQDINQEVSSFKQDVNEDIESITDMVESATSGSPKGVYATVSALTTADPNHNYIYVVTEDGKWYYYNTSTTSWTAGGVYQASANVDDVNDIIDAFDDESIERTTVTTVSPEVTTGYFVTKNGNVNENASYLYYSIENIQEGDIINLTQYDSMAAMLEVHNPPRFTCYYNDNVVVPDAGSDTEGSLPITVPSGVNKVTISHNARYINPVASITRTSTEVTKVLKNANNNHNVRRLSNGVPVIEGYKSSMLTGDTLKIAGRMDIKKNSVYNLYAKVNTMGSISFGHGKDVYGSSYVTVDATKVYTYYYGSTLTLISEDEHHLNIKDYIDIRVNVSDNSRGSIKIHTNGGSFTKLDFSWQGCNGDVTAWCNSGSFSDIKYTWTIPDLLNDIYIFGDSYISLPDPARWTSQLINSENFNKFSLNGFGGADSEDMYPSLVNTLSICQPKILVWALGMNDPDTSVINTSWAYYRDLIIDICEGLGIELVFCTIPNTPTMNNTYKNAWITGQSDYKYIDFASGVGALSDTTWYDGMLSNDNVHPTEAGAIALMCSAIRDLPELLKK